VAAILSLLTCGHIKPFRKETTVVLCERPQLARIYHSMPAYDHPEAEALYLDVARKPTLIIQRMRGNGQLKTWRDGKSGLPAIPELGHATKDCGCLELSLNNNVESRMYSTVCLPRGLLNATHPEDSYSDNLEHLNSSTMRYQNTGMVYCGAVSRYATTIPRLIRRQPLGRLQRDAPKFFKPWGAEVNMMERPDLLRALLVHSDRSEYCAFLRAWDNPEDESTEGRNWARFPSKQDQARSVDLHLAGWVHPVTVEEVMQDAVHIAPLWGPHLCGFCGTIVDVVGLPDLLNHLMTFHRRLKDSIFTCPSCLGVTTLTWVQFARHFGEAHAPATPLMMVLNEISSHTRMNWGIAMVALVTIQDASKWPMRAEEEEPSQYVSAWGGFLPLPNKGPTLTKMVKAAQNSLLPSGLVEKTESKRTTVATTQPRNQQRMTSRPSSAAPSRSQSPTWADHAAGEWKIPKKSRRVEEYDPSVMPKRADTVSGPQASSSHQYDGSQAFEPSQLAGSSQQMTHFQKGPDEVQDEFSMLGSPDVTHVPRTNEPPLDDSVLDEDDDDVPTTGNDTAGDDAQMECL